MMLCWGCARGHYIPCLFGCDVMIAPPADGFALLCSEGIKRWEAVVVCPLCFTTALYRLSTAHRKATSFALTLNEQPSHPSHPNDLRTKQTNTLTGKDAWGRWDIRGCFARYTCALCCHIHLWLYSSYSNLFASSARVYGWRHHVDAVWTGLFWIASHSCRIMALKVVFCTAVPALFQMHVIIACFGGLFDA